MSSYRPGAPCQLHLKGSQWRQVKQLEMHCFLGRCQTEVQTRPLVTFFRDSVNSLHDVVAHQMECLSSDFKDSAGRCTCWSRTTFLIRQFWYTSSCLSVHQVDVYPCTSAHVHPSSPPIDEDVVHVRHMIRLQQKQPDIASNASVTFGHQLYKNFTISISRPKNFPRQSCDLSKWIWPGKSQFPYL